jgi:arsenate reductase
MPQLFRILILCTGNSARSQIAEALVQALGGGRVEVASAGSHPAGAVNPLAVAVLHEADIEWQGRVPRSVEGLDRERWDLVITVCDHARDACPVFPHARVAVHWGMEDPAAVSGPHEVQLEAFRYTYRVLQRRVQSLLGLPLATMSDGELAREAQAVGDRQEP